MTPEPQLDWQRSNHHRPTWTAHVEGSRVASVSPGPYCWHWSATTPDGGLAMGWIFHDKIGASDEAKLAAEAAMRGERKERPR